MYREDEFEPQDPPHAFALMEGQPCSCPSRYYGGDCAHTLDREDWSDAAAERDPAIVTEAELRLLDGNR